MVLHPPAESDVPTLKGQVDQAWARSDWTEAMELLARLQMLAPDAMDYRQMQYVAHYNRGVQQLSVGETQAALLDFEDAANLDPARPEAKEAVARFGPASTSPKTSPATAVPAPPEPTPTPAPAPATPTPVILPGVGSEAQAGNWKIKFQNLRTANVLGDYSKETAQGRFVIVTLAATNLHNETSILNPWDFAMRSAEGNQYRVSTDGTWALIGDSTGPKPMSSGNQIQPGLTTQFRLVFDVNPNQKQFTLKAAGIDFAVKLP